MPHSPTVPGLPGISPHSIAPLAITRDQAITMLGSARLVQRMLYVSARALSPKDVWLELIPDGRAHHRLITMASVEASFARLRAGEVPQPLPSEVLRARRRDVDVGNPA